jgi:hypothetical protein
LAPFKKKPDIAWDAAGKIENARAQLEAVMPKILLPTQVELCRLAAQGLRPVPIPGECIDRASAIAAKIMRKAQKQELLHSTRSRLARPVQKLAPAFFGDVLANQHFDLIRVKLCRSAAFLLLFPVLLCLEIGGEFPEF